MKNCKKCLHIMQATDKSLSCMVRGITKITDVEATAEGCKHYRKATPKNNIVVAVKEQEGDAINPDHYKAHGVQCIKASRLFSFTRGSALKYIWRCYNKNKYREDLEKAVWYLKDTIEFNLDYGKDKEALAVVSIATGFKSWQRRTLEAIAGGQFFQAIYIIETEGFQNEPKGGAE